MTRTELNQKVRPIIDLFSVDRVFKVTELFDPVIWMSFSSAKQSEIATLFVELVKDELQEHVRIQSASPNLFLQTYTKLSVKTIKPSINVFPNEPVSIKRNERGNA